MKNSSDGSAVETLIELCRNGKLPQGLLLTGEIDAAIRAAERLGRILLCEKNGKDECSCRSCRTPLSGHPDFAVLAPNPRTIGKEAVHEAVASLAAGPVWARAKVIVVQAAESLGREAESFFLKHLEEPPPFVYYVLLTNAPDAILPTIRSRCQRWRLGASAARDMAGWDMLSDLRKGSLTAERVIDAAYWVRQQYRATQRRVWLDVWETLQETHRQLAANGNEELARARILRIWPGNP